MSSHEKQLEAFEEDKEVDALFKEETAKHVEVKVNVVKEETK